MVKFDWGNVLAVYKAPFQKNVGIQIRGASDKVNKIASPILQTITGAAVVGSALYGGSKLGIAALTPKTAAVASAAAPATAAATAANAGFMTGTIKAAGAGALGGLAIGRLLRNDNNQGQSTSPAIDAPQTQGTTSDINQDAFLDAGAGVTDVWGGRDVWIDNTRRLRTSQDVYNYQIPTQTATPSISTFQGQEATSGESLLIPALIIGAALFLK